MSQGLDAAASRFGAIVTVDPFTIYVPICGAMAQDKCNPLRAAVVARAVSHLDIGAKLKSATPAFAGLRVAIDVAPV